MLINFQCVRRSLKLIFIILRVKSAQIKESYDKAANLKIIYPHLHFNDDMADYKSLLSEVLLLNLLKLLLHFRESLLLEKDKLVYFSTHF